MKNFLNIDSTQFKTIMIIVMLIYLPIAFKIVLMSYNTTDIVPQLQAINTEVLKKLGAFSVRIKAGMFIRNIPVFDINKNVFSLDSIIWFEFNSDEINLDLIDKFSIDNGKITYRSPPDIKIEGSQVFVRYNILFDIKTDLTFYKFPFEDHRIPIVLSNDFVTPEEMFFVSDSQSFQTLPTVAPSGWKIGDMSVDAGYLPLQLNKQDVTKKVENPKVLFVINFIKASTRKSLIIFIPLFSAAFLSLLTFLMNAANVVGKFSLAVTAVTALLGYRFVIEQMMPQVGYFTTTDAIYLFLLIFAFIIFSMQLLLTRTYMVATASPPKDVDKQGPNLIQKLERINSILFIIMSLLLIGITSYIIFS